VSERVNLADPEFEPTDEQLIELSVRAFSGVRQAHEKALERLRAEIAKTGAAALRELDERLRRQDPK
jgi:hypothetical protein